MMHIHNSLEISLQMPALKDTNRRPFHRLLNIDDSVLYHGY